MALRARKPSMPTRRRCKVIVYGGPGVGKTMALLDFPGLYYIDTEGGSRESHYKQKMLARGIVELTPKQGASDFATVIDEFETLATTKHDFLTVGLDSFTALYLDKAAEAEAEVGNDFGKDRKEANKPTRQLLRWINRMDMNVVLICHSKEKWVADPTDPKKRVSAGQTFDGFEKLEYALDLMIEALPGGAGKPAIGVVRKTRLREFPVGDRFQLTYDEFANRFGREHLEHAAEEIELATADEIAKLRRLIKAAQIGDEVQGKWLHKAEAERFEEMARDAVLKLVSFCESRIAESIASDKDSAPEEVTVAV